MKNLPAKIHEIQFYDHQLQTLDHEGQPYVAMKPICEGMDLDWPTQLQNIKRDPVLNPVMGIIPTTGLDGKTYEMVCLPLKYLPGWLFKVDANRYEGRRQDIIIRYQQECYDVLYAYWFKGELQQKPDYGLTQAELRMLIRQEAEGAIENSPAIQEMRLKIERIDGNVIYLTEAMPKASISAETLRGHHGTTEAYYDGKCPLCRKTIIVKDGKPVPHICHEEHYKSPKWGGPKDTWITCGKCNQRKRQNLFSESFLKTQFEAFQQWREIYIKENKIGKKSNTLPLVQRSLLSDQLEPTRYKKIKVGKTTKSDL